MSKWKKNKSIKTRRNTIWAGGLALVLQRILLSCASSMRCDAMRRKRRRRRTTRAIRQTTPFLFDLELHIIK